MPRLQFSEAKGSQFLLKKKKHWLHSDTDTEDRKRFENKISAVDVNMVIFLILFI